MDVIYLALVLLFAPAQDLAPAPAPAPAPLAEPVAQEIVVIARKLKTWRGAVNSSRGGFTCRTKKSSGDPEIDAIGCASMLHCWPAALPRFQASLANGVSKADRNRLQSEANAGLAACGEQQHRERIEALALRRTAA